MAEEAFIFETVSRLSAGARGVPGKRSFYFIAGQESAWVRIWLEKEQLQTLAEAVDQLMTSLSAQEQQSGAPEEDSAGLPEPPEPPAGEFHLGRLALGHDARRDMIVLVVHKQEQREGRQPILQIWASRAQMRALSQRIKEVCAAGRPLCPLCGGPLDPEGHPCPKANGHHPMEVEQR